MKQVQKNRKPVALSNPEITAMLKDLPEWKRKGKEIFRQFNFTNYYETLAFVNAVAWVANSQNHHPDLEVGYNKCRVRYSTHDVGGLSLKDLVCAAKVDSLLK